MISLYHCYHLQSYLYGDELIDYFHMLFVLSLILMIIRNLDFYLHYSGISKSDKTTSRYKLCTIYFKNNIKEINLTNFDSNVTKIIKIVSTNSYHTKTSKSKRSFALNRVAIRRTYDFPYLAFFLFSFLSKELSASCTFNNRKRSAQLWHREMNARNCSVHFNKVPAKVCNRRVLKLRLWNCGRFINGQCSSGVSMCTT